MPVSDQEVKLLFITRASCFLGTYHWHIQQKLSVAFFSISPAPVFFSVWMSFCAVAFLLFLFLSFHGGREGKYPSASPCNSPEFVYFSHEAESGALLMAVGKKFPETSIIWTPFFTVSFFHWCFIVSPGMLFYTRKHFLKTWNGKGWLHWWSKVDGIPF